MKLLLVEDNLTMQTTLQRSLSRRGMDVATCGDGRQALDKWSAFQPDVVVLDLTLPGMDGLQVLQRARSSGWTTPVLILTARGTVGDRIIGLNTGADDYLPKPFAMDEMVARVRALLRRPVEFRALDPGHGDLVLRSAASLLCCGDRTATLAPAEVHIMLLLLSKPRETVRRNALEAAAWGLSEAVTPNALDVALHRLRRKLLAIGSRQRIVNARGLGYALREDELAQ